MPPRAWRGTAAQTDQEVFERALDVLLNDGEDGLDTPLSIEISNLESLAHDLDYGVKLVQPDPLQNLLVLARTKTENSIRQSAARVIGSALRNNPEAMTVVKGTRLVPELINILKGEEDAGVRASLIFALSAAAAGEDEIREFVTAKGPLLLQEIFDRGEPEVQGKCATFVEDNLSYNPALSGIENELTEWCRLFQHFLKRSPGGVISEKVLSSLMSFLNSLLIC
jgi:nucleotide exchange factor SIL1